MTAFIALIIAAITYGTPLLFGTLGEILTEKSGNLNLGVEGIMFMGGAIGLGGVFYYEKAVSVPNGILAVLIGMNLLCGLAEAKPAPVRQRVPVRRVRRTPTRRAIPLRVMRGGRAA